VSGAKLVLLVGDSKPAVDRAVSGSARVSTVCPPVRPVMQQHQTCIIIIIIIIIKIIIKIKIKQTAGGDAGGNMHVCTAKQHDNRD